MLCQYLKQTIRSGIFSCDMLKENNLKSIKFSVFRPSYNTKNPNL